MGEVGLRLLHVKPDHALVEVVCVCPFHCADGLGSLVACASVELRFKSQCEQWLRNKSPAAVGDFACRSRSRV